MILHNYTKYSCFLSNDWGRVSLTERGKVISFPAKANAISRSVCAKKGNYDSLRFCLFHRKRYEKIACVLPFAAVKGSFGAKRRTICCCSYGQFDALPVLRAVRYGKSRKGELQGERGKRFDDYAKIVKRKGNGKTAINLGADDLRHEYERISALGIADN